MSQKELIKWIIGGTIWDYKKVILTGINKE